MESLGPHSDTSPMLRFASVLKNFRAANDFEKFCPGTTPQGHPCGRITMSDTLRLFMALDLSLGPARAGGLSGPIRPWAASSCKTGSHRSETGGGPSRAGKTPRPKPEALRHFHFSFFLFFIFKRGRRPRARDGLCSRSNPCAHTQRPRLRRFALVQQRVARVVIACTRQRPARQRQGIRHLALRRASRVDVGVLAHGSPPPITWRFFSCVFDAGPSRW